VRPHHQDQRTRQGNSPAAGTRLARAVPERDRGSTRPSGCMALHPRSRFRTWASAGSGAASSTRYPGPRRPIAVRAFRPAEVRAPAPTSSGHCSGASALRAGDAAALPRSRAQPPSPPLPSVVAWPVQQRSSWRGRASPPVERRGLSDAPS
jgi:hypothetical protein